ncbi:MAG: hypothetical protein ACLPWF_23455 [Bryobacteraceae bacterium]
MPNNKITDLRNHLFETIEALKDPDKPMDIQRAKAISEIAQTIINSAKVEVEMVNAIGGMSGTGFFNLPEESRALPKPGMDRQQALQPPLALAARKGG